MLSLRKLQPQAITKKAIRLSPLVVVIVAVAINSSKSQEKNKHQQIIIAIYYYEGFKTTYINSNKVEQVTHHEETHFQRIETKLSA